MIDHDETTTAEPGARRGGEPAPNLDAPETIHDLSLLTPGELALAAGQLERELEAPQTPTAFAKKRRALRRIRIRLGRRRAMRHVIPTPRRLQPRPGSRFWTEREKVQLAARPLPSPARAVDGFLALLDGWNFDFANPAEIERIGVPHYSPERMLEILVRAFAAGQIARAGSPDITPGAADAEQLALPIARGKAA